MFYTKVKWYRIASRERLAQHGYSSNVWYYYQWNILDFSKLKPVKLLLENSNINLNELLEYFAFDLSWGSSNTSRLNLWNESLIILQATQQN